MTLRLLTEHHLKFLSLKGGCTGLSESTLVKMPHDIVGNHMSMLICFQAFRYECGLVSGLPLHFTTADPFIALLYGLALEHEY